MVEAITKEMELKQVFKEYAKFGNPKSDGAQITLTNCDKWMKDAKIIDGKKVSTTDTAIQFQKFKSKTLDFKQFVTYVENIAKDSKQDPNVLKELLSKCNDPSRSGATTSDKSDVVKRMTDTSKYTGSHKERFDSSGKGKGKHGREDNHDNTGYVQGYKHKDTYHGKKEK